MQEFIYANISHKVLRLISCYYYQGDKIVENKISTSADMYEILKQRIIKLVYAPGQVLNEKDIASEFNVSRTPVRRIFEQLKSDKLLNIIPRYGAQVAPIDFLYMKSVIEVTRELEGYAARLAAERITEKKIKELEAIIDRIKQYSMGEDYKDIIIEDQIFHAVVFESCGNPCLVEILQGLHMHTERLWLYTQPDISETDLYLDTLPKIVSSLKARDTEQASNYTKSHIDLFIERIKQDLL